MEHPLERFDLDLMTGKGLVPFVWNWKCPTLRRLKGGLAACAVLCIVSECLELALWIRNLRKGPKSLEVSEVTGAWEGA